jgi:bifunctional non-homologous end joining protein LigD
MLYAFSLPTKADKVPAGPDWLHEIKYDGYRMMVIREQDGVRLISRGGNDWARRFPLIVEAALTLRQKHFVIDGEIVVLDRDGEYSDSTGSPKPRRSHLADDRRIGGKARQGKGLYQA